MDLERVGLPLSCDHRESTAQSKLISKMAAGGVSGRSDGEILREVVCSARRCGRGKLLAMETLVGRVFPLSAEKLDMKERETLSRTEMANHALLPYSE